MRRGCEDGCDCKQAGSIASLTAYLFYKEEEIQRLITIMERVRYGLPPEQTAGYMKGVIGV
ncbi:V-type ATPase subunit [Anaerostipes sp.]|uniref:V-type ATPase subunit n=1 Tax=unclassified Anaerostipes TaxID=2635253 RepID=UPI002580C64E|nr:V-type ATPase subunit [Anaerostipes sp.]WRY49091.1 V-type ATPase subunit [Anaerostipes sp. PC18]